MATEGFVYGFVMKFLSTLLVVPVSMACTDTCEGQCGMYWHMWRTVCMYWPHCTKHIHAFHIGKAHVLFLLDFPKTSIYSLFEVVAFLFPRTILTKKSSHIYELSWTPSQSINGKQVICDMHRVYYFDDHFLMLCRQDKSDKKFKVYVSAVALLASYCQV